MDFNHLKNGLIVSCQAHYNHPLNDPLHITAMALSAKEGGAIGIRADGEEHIASIKKRVDLPIIGIFKEQLRNNRFFITPTFEHAKRIVQAGADIVALEATFENQPNNEELGILINRVKLELGTSVMADISTYEEGVRAWKLGADFVGTTLSGYTELTKDKNGTNFELVSQLSERGIRTICEGHIKTPDQARKAIECGAFCVVVGTAITDPLSITKWYSTALQNNKDGSNV